LRRKGLADLVLGLLRLPLALIGSLRLVRAFRPHLSVSVGGYAAGPAVLASRLLGIPCVVMEQNAVPGFTNRVLGRLARRVIAGLPTRGFASRKVRVLGNPVRGDLISTRDAPYEPHMPRRLLVFGGSQGARALNEVMMAAARRLHAAPLAISVFHQTGEADRQRVEDAYQQAGLDGARVTPFIDDMADAYRDADLVLCRAGAMTLAELTVCGRPAVLVPYPYAVDDHQSANARTLAETGAAIHLPQAELDANRLVELLVELLVDEPRLRAMAARSRAAGKPDAVRDIADALALEVSCV
jgi:UDP-N-acetylglucosamine--N-acetylmuramyl-(pentapeptide) pyrophosphoryl-undecaprenol N-acetylglucosamine transferase